MSKKEKKVAFSSQDQVQIIPNECRNPLGRPMNPDIRNYDIVTDYPEDEYLEEEPVRSTNSNIPHVPGISRPLPVVNPSTIENQNSISSKNSISSNDISTKIEENPLPKSHSSSFSPTTGWSWIDVRLGFWVSGHLGFWASGHLDI